MELVGELVEVLMGRWWSWWSWWRELVLGGELWLSQLLQLRKLSFILNEVLADMGFAKKTYIWMWIF